MKPIGPYVAVQALPPPVTGTAAANSLIQTLRATDRLTGIPVLLHVLPYAQSLPELPVSAHLLPVVDSGIDGEQAYLVTELPLQAHPAGDPLLTAHGVLAALNTLHGQGLAHGGVSRAQLWNHDGGVALAGAGLPWREDATPQDDLSDLAVTLQEMGTLPEALKPLRDHPGSLSAREALFLLNGDPALEGTPQPSPRSENEHVPLAMLGDDVPGNKASEGTSDTPHVRVISRSQANGSGDAATQAPPPLPSAGHSGETKPEKSADGARQKGGDAPASTPLVSPFSNAPKGKAETPQERRKRQNDERREQALMDTQAAAQRRTALMKARKEEEDSEAAKAAEQVALGVPVPEPFQMGFVAAPEAVENRPPADLQTRQIERLPASLRRPTGAETQGTVQRLPGGEAVSSRPSSRNLTPIRIGWDEDDSWRVVRTAPEARPTSPLLRWLPLVLALLVLLVLGLLWLGRTTTVAAPVNTGSAASSRAVTFTLRGAAGVTAQLSVVSAPDGANLKADQNLGVIPGQIRFPVEGLYRLKVSARGYRPATLDVTVPRTQPVPINLGN